MIRPIKQFTAFAALAVAMALPALAGDELKPRDLTPVTWLDTPSHPPSRLCATGSRAL